MMKKDRYFSTQSKNSTFTWASPEIVYVTGYTEDELVNKLPYDYFNKEDIARIAKHHMNGLIHNVQNLKYRWIHKDGHDVWCQVYFSKHLEDGLICLTKKMKWWEIIFFKIELYINTKRYKL